MIEPDEHNIILFSGALSKNIFKKLYGLIPLISDKSEGVSNNHLFFQ